MFGFLTLNFIRGFGDLLGGKRVRKREGGRNGERGDKNEKGKDTVICLL